MIYLYIYIQWGSIQLCKKWLCELSRTCELSRDHISLPNLKCSFWELKKMLKNATKMWTIPTKLIQFSKSVLIACLPVWIDIQTHKSNYVKEVSTLQSFTLLQYRHLGKVNYCTLFAHFHGLFHNIRMSVFKWTCTSHYEQLHLPDSSYFLKQVGPEFTKIFWRILFVLGLESP